jgi:hypothetical protein
MQAKVQPFRPTHLYKSTYGILESMIFEVFLVSAKTFSVTRDIHGILHECVTKCFLPYDPMLAGQPYSGYSSSYYNIGRYGVPTGFILDNS